MILQHHHQWNQLLVSIYCIVPWQMIQRILQVPHRIRILPIVVYAVLGVPWWTSNSHHLFKILKPAKTMVIQVRHTRRKILLPHHRFHQMDWKSKIWLYLDYLQQRISHKATATASTLFLLSHPTSLVIGRNANYGGDNKRHSFNLSTSIPLFVFM